MLRSNLMMGGPGSKPRIGVPYRTKKEQAAGEKSKIQRYVKAVQMAGGDPIAIPLDLSTSALQNLAQTLDGVALSGSPADIDPMLFQAVPHAKAAAPDPDRQRTDFGMLEEMFSAQKPVLAICYGIQSLNVFLGGTLVQDIPSELGSDVEHDVPGDRGAPETFHDVLIERGSRLAEFANGAPGARVNSSHHQAALRPGRGLRITARASDGLIEALEGTSEAHWVMAVQWHPERMAETDPLALALFRGLIVATRKRPVRV